MTTARELGFHYDPRGKLIGVDTKVRLNNNGAKFVQESAIVFGYEIGTVTKGYVVPKVTWGINGAMISLLIPASDGRECPVNVSMDSDYFLPPEAQKSSQGTGHG